MYLFQGTDCREKPIQRAGGAGPDIRALRKRRGLTLTELSACAGRSVGWLSEVERGLCDPTHEDLRRIAQRLSVSPSIFLTDPETPDQERGRIVRRGAGRRVGASEGGISDQLLSPDLCGSVDVLHRVFPPFSQSSSGAGKGVEEACYVISGALEIRLSGLWHKLEPGDCFRLRDEEYQWRNMSGAEVVAIWISSSPAAPEKREGPAPARYGFRRP